MPDAWDEYLAAEIRIEAPGGIVLLAPAPPLQCSGAYPDPEGRPLAVITACNPGGRLADPLANAAATGRLAAELAGRGLPWWPAAGADPTWTHVADSVAVPGLSQDEAREIGRRFSQEAVFLLTPASRKVIGCATGRMSITGWAAGPDRWGEYLAEAGRRRGLLTALHTDGASITLRGDGTGAIAVRGAGAAQATLPGAEAALHYLAHVQAFDSGIELASGAWDAGDVATLVARYLPDSEFAIDGVPWYSDGRDAVPAAASGWEPLVLAADRWGEASGEFLLRIGPRYAIFATNGAEVECDYLDASDEQEAVAQFTDLTGGP